MLSGCLLSPADLPAEPEPATVRASSAEGWGKVPQPWADPASNLVGETGDPELIEFSGNQTFSTATIRKQLMMSAGYMLGSHHLALRGPFLVMLREKIRSGYQNCGFPEPAVEVRYDKERRRAEVRILEGKRYRCGEVLVEGVPADMAKTLITRLTIRPESTNYPALPAGAGTESSRVTYNAEIRAKDASRSRPFAREADQTVFWEAGEPVSFVESVRQELQRIAQQALAQHGLFFPKLEVKIRTSAEKTTAELIVEVVDPGPKAVIDEIVVEGCRKNTKAQILDFLGLKTGMPINRATLDEAELKLWDSGRFRLYELDPELTPAENPADRHLRLVIRVVEFDSIPGLSEPLSETQKAMLLLARYIAGAGARGEELVLKATGKNDVLPMNIFGEVILAPGKGFLMRIADPKAELKGFAYSFTLSDTNFAIYDHARKARLAIANAKLNLRAFLSLLPTPPEDTNTVNFSVGAGFTGVTSEDKRQKPGMYFEFTIAPAAMVEQAKNFAGETVLANDSWTIIDSNIVLRIDARTGRLEQLTWTFSEHRGETNRMSIQLATGAFAKACGELETAGGACTNYYSPDHPATSTVAFLAGEFLRLGLYRLATNMPAARRELLASSLERLITPEFLDVDPEEQPGPAEETFAIPLDVTDLAVAQNNLLALYSGIVFRYCSEWFPKYSWPWTLARESALVLASKGLYADGELERISRSEDTGPVGSLVTAWLLGQVNPAAGRTFATRGLTRLSATDFKADCRLFLEGDSGLARTFAKLAASLRKMPESEVEALAANLPLEEATLLRDSAKALRASPNETLVKVLSPALDRYWDTSLRAIVRAKLLKLSVSLQNHPRTRTDL
jgi:hypothetical protein